MTAYVIGEIEVTDPAAYEDYRKQVLAVVTQYGGRFLVRGGKYETVKGASRSRNVLIEFPSYEAALECFHSPEYQAALRAQGGSAEVDLIVIEGYDGPQPG